MHIKDDIAFLKGVGPETATKLKRLKIHSVGDLINHWPRRFEDYSVVQKVKDIVPGPVSLEVTFDTIKAKYVRRGLHITEAAARDDSGAVKVVWFNQPYRADHLKSNTPYFLSGELAFARSQISITNPAVELVSELPANTARILPKYRETRGLNSGTIRKLLMNVRPLIRHLPENLPTWVIKQADLMSHAEAIETIHFPVAIEDLSAAKRRLAFEEAFGLTMASLLARQLNEAVPALPITFDEVETKKFIASLPFTLTDHQRAATWQALQDMQKTTPMNRLVEGDVGSGKTVVAAICALNAINDGYQSLLLAPTELLARQHFANLEKMLGKHRVSLLIGSHTAKQKADTKALAKAHKSDLIIGTHALLEETLEMKKLGLVIVDEQHRFGVRQRQRLVGKSDHAPHVLSLTATPIPRSLALTLYGELDISVIAQKPVGRKEIITEIGSPDSRPQLYAKVDKMIDAGSQVYVVCPLISQSDVVKHISVTELHELLAKKILKHRRVGLLHGKLKGAEKDAIMQDFINKKLDVLVSTTVIEVGVDVPNASVMVIEGADAFGLAQLHQLRGRVGRGSDQAYCYLVPSTSEKPSQRLRAMVSTSDGFKLAELDLRLRGAGQIYGTLQHGALDLRMIRLSDTALIAEARNAAQAFIDKGENLVDYPELADRIHNLRTITVLN